VKGSGLEHRPVLSGLADVSGISDAAAPGALGKVICAYATGTIRDLPDRVADVLLRLLIVPLNARIYTERGGTGNEYHTLKYRVPDPVTGAARLMSHYLGYLDDDQLKWARAVLEERVARAAQSGTCCQPLDIERIKQLHELRKQAHRCARVIAHQAGYTWRGFRLLKRRRKHDDTHG
jgi:hypothetical protein